MLSIFSRKFHYFATILTALILSVVLARPAFAQGPTCTVSNNADSGPNTLRQCLADVNAGGVIDFNLTYPATIPTNGDDYSFSKPLTINGPGPENLTIQGNGSSESVFYIWDLDATDVVTLSGMTIRDGYYDDGGGIYMYDSYGTLVVSNTHILENEAHDGDGGGIFVDDDGTLIVHSSVISGNITADDGGGIHMEDNTVLTVTNSLISNNIAEGSDYGGGGISLYYAISAYITGTTISDNETEDYEGGGITAHETDWLTVINSDISDNIADEEGGGISSDDGTVTVISSTITGNSNANYDGGGIYSDGPLIVHSSVISGNYADSDGGGIANFSTLTVTNSLIDNNECNGDSGGGGIFIEDATAFITGTTVSNNRSTYDDGGGICTYDDDEVITIVNSSIVDNYAEDDGGGLKLDGCTAVISNTLISGNEAYSGGGGIHIDYDSVVTITGSTLSENLAREDGGGGIYNYDSDNLVIRNTDFISNTSGEDEDGGGLHHGDSDDLVIENCDFIGNTSYSNAGALSSDGAVTISDSLFRGNSAPDGDSGALYASGNLVISNTNFISNTASGDYGAFGSDGDITITNTQSISNTAGGCVGTFWSGGAVTISNSLFRGNEAEDGHNGVFSVYDGTVAISNTDFINNTASGNNGAFGICGDGDHADNNGVSISNSLFQGNTAGGDRGVFYTPAYAIITNTQFISNTAASGAIYSEDDLIIVNSLLANNGMTDGGSVIASSNVTMTHTTIASATLGGGSAIAINGGTLNAANNLIANYTTGITGSGTINEDYNLFAGISTPVNSGSPRAHSWSSSNFSVAGFVNAADDDFHLTSSSWALNKGTNAGIAVDFDGDARPGGGGYDLGYDETTYTGPTAADDTATTLVNIAVTISPLTNDTQTDGDALHIGAVGSPANGTATISSAGSQLVFTPTTGYSGTVVFTYTAREASQLEKTATITVTVEKISDLYFPLIFKGYTVAPDLVVESFVPTSSGITIVIKNEGDMAVTENFWVDVYFDPTETPTLNHEWESIAAHGAVWGVTDNIPAGSTLTLTVGDKYYDANESSNPPFPVGVPVYTYIDSINYNTDYGNIRELDETDNLFGPVISTAGAEAILPLSGESPSSAQLPGRK